MRPGGENYCTENFIPGENTCISKMARRLRGQALNPVFHKQSKIEDEGQLSLGLIKQARNSGSLNLSGRGLATGKVPHSIQLNSL